MLACPPTTFNRITGPSHRCFSPDATTTSAALNANASAWPATRRLGESGSALSSSALAPIALRYRRAALAHVP